MTTNKHELPEAAGKVVNMKKMRSMFAIAIALLLALSTVTFANANYSGASTPVYLFYSYYLDDYFITASETERASLERDYRNGTQTYEYLGVLGYAEAYATATNVPVYRFWNKDTTDHFYTTSYTEKTQTEENYNSGRDGYKYEGIAFYVPAYGYSAVYRFFNTATFSHAYITDESVKDDLILDSQYGYGCWRYEGVAWYW